MFIISRTFFSQKVFFYIIKKLSVYAYVHLHVCMHLHDYYGITIMIWLEDSLQDFIFSDHVSSRNQTEVVRLGERNLFLIFKRFIFIFNSLWGHVSQKSFHDLDLLELDNSGCWESTGLLSRPSSQPLAFIFIVFFFEDLRFNLLLF